MRKVMGFFALVGLISLPLVSGLTVSAVTSTPNYHQMSEQSAIAGPSSSIAALPTAKAPFPKR